MDRIESQSNENQAQVEANGSDDRLLKALRRMLGESGPNHGGLKLLAEKLSAIGGDASNLRAHLCIALFAYCSMSESERNAAMFAFGSARVCDRDFRDAMAKLGFADEQI